MTNLTKVFPDKKEKTDFWIAITVILLFLTANIYYLFAYEKQDTLPSDFAVEQDEQKNPDFLYETKETSIGKIYEPKKADEAKLSALVIAIEKPAANTDKKTTIKAETNIIDSSEMEISKTPKEIPPVYIEDEEEENEKIEPKDSITIQEPKKEIEVSNEFELTTVSGENTLYGCIIMVGSFKEPKNAKVLTEVLKKQDYPVYEGVYKGYYVVGVNTDCEEATILPLLKVMKKEYEKDAWIYKR